MEPVSHLTISLSVKIILNLQCNGQWGYFGVLWWWVFEFGKCILERKLWYVSDLRVKSPLHVYFGFQVEDRLDRLEDVIHVLRNHAVGGTNINLTNDMRSLIGLTQQGAITMRSNCPVTGLMTNGLPTDVSPCFYEQAFIRAHNHNLLQCGGDSRSEMYHKSSFLIISKWASSYS